MLPRKFLGIARTRVAIRGARRRNLVEGRERDEVDGHDPPFHFEQADFELEVSVTPLRDDAAGRTAGIPRPAIAAAVVQHHPFPLVDVDLADLTALRAEG